MKILFEINEESKTKLDLLYAKKIAWKFAENNTAAIINVRNKTVEFLSGETILGITGPWSISILSELPEDCEDEIVFSTQTAKIIQIFAKNAKIEIDTDNSKIKSVSPIATLEFLATINSSSDIEDVATCRDAYADMANHEKVVDVKVSSKGRISQVLSAIKRISSEVPVTQISSDLFICMVPQYIIYHETVESLTQQGDEVNVTTPFYINQFMMNILTNLSDLTEAAYLVSTDDGKLFIFTDGEIKATYASDFNMQDAYSVDEAMPSVEEIEALYPKSEDDDYHSFTCKIGELIAASDVIKQIASSIKMNTNKYHIGYVNESTPALKAKKDIVMGDLKISSSIGSEEDASEATFNERFAIPIPPAIEALCAYGDLEKDVVVSYDPLVYTAVKVGIADDSNIVCLLSKDFS